METQTYEALLSNPQHIAQVRAAERAIKGIGGTLQFVSHAHDRHDPRERDMVLVVLELPLAYVPATFFPGMPFYPV